MKSYLLRNSGWFIIVLLIGCSEGSKKRCSMDNSLANTSYVTTSSILNTLSSKYTKGYVEFPFTLFENEKFKEVIDNPCNYRLSLISALKDKEKPRAFKLIALYCLQHLCIDDYLDVLNTVRDEFNKGNLDEKFLMSSVSQDGFSLEVSKSYFTKELQSFFKEVLPTLKIADSRIYLVDIMSGKNWTEQRKYLRQNSDSMPWLCN